jgi:hypothetical protein
MRRNLLLVILVFSLVFFFSKLGLADNSMTLTGASLSIHPCVGGGAVEIDANISTTDEVVAFVLPITATGTAGAVLDTVLTGGLLDANPPAFNAPSLVSAFTQRIVNPYGIGGYGGVEPMLFVAVSFTTGVTGSGLYCKMFYNVTGPGTIVIDTMTHSTGGGFGMNDPAGPVAATWGGPYTFNVVREAIVPVTLNCPAAINKFVGDVIPINISATAGNTPIQGIIVPPVACGSAVLSGSTGNWTYTWTTTGCADPNLTGTLTFGVYDECETTFCDVPYKLTASAVFVKIGCVEGNPGEIVDVPVMLKPTQELGGFDLYIEFDPTVLYFKGVKWMLPSTFEWKTYRQLPCPMCGCCKYKLELLGIYDIKNLTQGVPLQPSEDFITIASLDFQIAADENLRGYDLNVCFEFDDGVCTENSFSDVTGNILFVSDNPDFFSYADCDTEFDGNNTVLALATFQLFAPPCTENPLGRPCGGVFVPTTGIKQRGDINLNLLAYDIGDAVLFSSYFIYGTSVFDIDQPVQIANTDINADGYPLGLSDFVLMLRIMAHDATAIPKPTPGSDLATIYAVTKGNEVKVSTNANLGAALFVFQGDVKVTTDLKNVQGVVDGQTRVLVYMSSGTGMTGELLTAEAKPISVEAVDNFSRPVKATIVNRAVPTAFSLNANYPNPFNPTTNISFGLPVDSKVSLKIYNVAGQLVRTLVNETMVAGTHTVTWDGANSNGEKVASGIYFYKLNAGDFSKTMKMVMTK